MFGVGFGEIILIAVVVMIFFGPQKLPEVMHQIGKIYVHFRRHSQNFRDAFEKAVKDIEDEVIAKERDKIRTILVEESKILNATKTELENELHSVGAVASTALSITTSKLEAEPSFSNLTIISHTDPAKQE